MKKTPTRPNKPTKAEIERTNALRHEIFSIFQEVANQYYSMMEKRDQTLQGRLSAIEATGVPENTLGEINRSISSIRYKQNQLQRAMEGLLQFSNITKQLFEPEPENK